MTDITWTNCTVKLGNLKPWADNPRCSSKAQAKRILASIGQFGQVAPIVVDPDNNVLDGHQRLSALLTVHSPDYVVEARRSSRALSDDERRALVLALANATGSWNWDSLSNWNTETLKEWGFDSSTLSGWRDDVKNLGEFLKSEQPQAKQSLSEMFLVPPFSVLDAELGYRRERKRAWVDLGIESEIGREEGLLHFSETVRIQKNGKPKEEDNNTSVFDPFLAEIIYTWFCPPFGQILDPFAGGSVRGIVAHYLGYHYIGIDLRQEQIEANEKQAREIVPDCLPVWMCGDSRNLSKMLNTQFDFIFSCPPYFDLEIYSENEQDLSNAGDYDKFVESYRDIIKQAISLLKDNRFACFVVGDIRDKRGFYRNFPADTIAAFEDAGAILYNEIIFATPRGTLPLRVNRFFSTMRKVGKRHQNVLVFYKGDPKAIKSDFGEIEIAELSPSGG